MKKYILSLTLFLFLILAGCMIQTNPFSYQENLNDYEIKKIVKEVFLSQHTINRAGLITSDGLQNITLSHNRSLFQEQYSCFESGYLTLYFHDNDFSLTLSTNDLFTLTYYDCTYANTYYATSRIDGSINITIHQNIENWHTKLLDFSVAYLGTSLYAGRENLFLEGNIGVHYDQDYTNHSLCVSFTTNQFSIKTPTAYKESIFYNLLLDFCLDLSTLYYHYTYSGTLYNSYMGKLSFTTLQSMQGYKEQNPFSGKLKITNANLTLIVIPQDDYYVNIVVQNHFYPAYNRTIHTTWLNIGL